MTAAPNHAEPNPEAASSRHTEKTEPLPRPAPRDWSNLVFAAPFCEEVRRAFENRRADPRETFRSA